MIFQTSPSLILLLKMFICLIVIFLCLNLTGIEPYIFICLMIIIQKKIKDFLFYICTMDKIFLMFKPPLLENGV